MKEEQQASTGLSFMDLYVYLEDVAHGKANPNNLRGAGQIVLSEEELGKVAEGYVIKLRVETCGPKRVRFLMYCGLWMIQTQQFDCIDFRHGHEMARDYAIIWINNSMEFALVRGYAAVQAFSGHEVHA